MLFFFSYSLTSDAPCLTLIKLSAEFFHIPLHNFGQDVSYYTYNKKSAKMGKFTMAKPDFYFHVGNNSFSYGCHTHKGIESEKIRAYRKKGP